MARSRRSDEPAPDGAPTTSQEGADQVTQSPASAAADDAAPAESTEQDARTGTEQDARTGTETKARTGTEKKARAGRTSGRTATRSAVGPADKSADTSAAEPAEAPAEKHADAAKPKSSGRGSATSEKARAAVPDEPADTISEVPSDEPAGTSSDKPARRSSAKTPVARTAAATSSATRTTPAEPDRPTDTTDATDEQAAARRVTRPRRPRSSKPAPQRVAVVIPCKDESRRIAATVRAARAIPHVDLVLVVDDGSEDATQHVAREAGAVVVRHSHNRGKAAAMETGAAVVAMRDVEDGPARLLLFLDGDLGESAVNAAPLVPPVLAGETDATIALLPPQPGAGGRGIVVGLARRSIQAMTGWTPTQPLSGMRCLTREAFEAATPLARGWGVETGMTIDLLSKGFRIREVPCDLRHRPSGTDLRGQLHRAAQYRDVLIAVNARRARRLVRRSPRPPQAED